MGSAGSAPQPSTRSVRGPAAVHGRRDGWYSLACTRETKHNCQVTPYTFRGSGTGIRYQVTQGCKGWSQTLVESGTSTAAAVRYGTHLFRYGHAASHEIAAVRQLAEPQHAGMRLGRRRLCVMR